MMLSITTETKTDSNGKLIHTIIKRSYQYDAPFLVQRPNHNQSKDPSDLASLEEAMSWGWSPRMWADADMNRRGIDVRSETTTTEITSAESERRLNVHGRALDAYVAAHASGAYLPGSIELIAAVNRQLATLCWVHEEGPRNDQDEAEVISEAIRTSHAAVAGTGGQHE